MLPARAAVTQRYNLLGAGGTSSGKTTLANALLAVASGLVIATVTVAARVRRGHGDLGRPVRDRRLAVVVLVGRLGLVVAPPVTVASRVHETG